MEKISTIAKTLVLFATCALLWACGGISPRFYPLTENVEITGKPRPADQVEMFITKKPDFKYREIGMIIYEIPSSYSDEPQVYNALREKAGQVGADAIIIMDSQSTIVNMNRVIMDYYGNPFETDAPRSYTKYRAMAISKIAQ